MALLAAEVAAELADLNHHSRDMGVGVGANAPA